MPKRRRCVPDRRRFHQQPDRHPRPFQAHAQCATPFSPRGMPPWPTFWAAHLRADQARGQEVLTTHPRRDSSGNPTSQDDTHQELFSNPPGSVTAIARHPTGPEASPAQSVTLRNCDCRHRAFVSARPHHHCRGGACHHSPSVVAGPFHHRPRTPPHLRERPPSRMEPDCCLFAKPLSGMERRDSVSSPSATTSSRLSTPWSKPLEFLTGNGLRFLSGEPLRTKRRQVVLNDHMGNPQPSPLSQGVSDGLRAHTAKCF